jgi:hypothetical protein
MSLLLHAPRSRCTLLAAVVIASAVVSASGASAVATTTPVIAVGQLSVAPGHTVHVTGAGWPARALVHLEVCGNEAADGTVDCSLSSAIDVATQASGEFSSLLTVAAPPKPCPCVVRATTLAGDAVALRRIEIAGVGTAPVTRRPLPDISDYLAVTAVRFEDRPGWTSWFGAGFSRTLLLTIRNVGPDRVDTAELAITSGRGADPKGFVASPPLGTIERGENVTLRVAVRYDALSFGTYRVKAQISGFGEPIVVRRGTSIYPWALFVSLALVVQLTLLALRNRARRRLLRDEPRVSELRLPVDLAEPAMSMPAPTAPSLGAEIAGAREEWADIVQRSTALRIALPPRTRPHVRSN